MSVIVTLGLPANTAVSHRSCEGRPPSGEERSPSFYLNSFHFKAFTSSPFLNWLSLAAIETVNFHRQCLYFALQ